MFSLVIPKEKTRRKNKKNKTTWTNKNERDTYLENIINSSPDHELNEHMNTRQWK